MTQPEIINVKLTRIEAISVRGFLEAAVQAMKEQTTVTQWEEPIVQAIVQSVNQLVDQLPEEM